MSEPQAYLHGRFLPQSQASLPLHDAGFVFGATVTDFCRTFRHRLYLLDRHLARFRDGAHRIGIALPLAVEEIGAIAEQLVTHNAGLLLPEQELALITFITPGPIGYYAGKEGNGQPTLGMHTFPLPFGRYVGFFRDGVRLVAPAIRQVPRGCIDPSIKHRSRLHWWLASRHVGENSIALLLDERAHVTETALANFLIVKAGTVLTPPADSVLWGVSVQVVQELCNELGIPFAQKSLSLDDCLAASEAMLCGTAFCLAGVSRINHHALPWPGPIFERLLAAWSQTVGLDIRAQFLPIW
jgi:branched-chain amino acid aminotransferase